MGKPLGYKATRLLKMLNTHISVFGQSKVVWRSEDLHIAQGAWRTNENFDVWRWEAFSRFLRDDGSLGGVAHSVGSYATMTELVKYKRLYLIGDEVEGTNKLETDHDQ